jgi:hypothetical protein
MKLRYVNYLLLALVACKNGGDLAVPSRSKLSGLSFSQAFASATFSNSQGVTFSQSPSNQFTFTSGSTTFSFSSRTSGCSSMPSSVLVNNVTVDFPPAVCGTGFVRFYDGNGQLVDTQEYYYINTSRYYGNRIEFLFFGFLGKEPRTGTYSTSELFFSEYSIFERRPDGLAIGIESYFANSGLVSTNATQGFLVKSSNLIMVNDFDQSIALKIDLGCCAN